jgi:hypothetical protein
MIFIAKPEPASKMLRVKHFGTNFWTEYARPLKSGGLR